MRFVQNNVWFLGDAGIDVHYYDTRERKRSARVPRFCKF